MSDPSHPIYYLRHVELDPKLALQLSPFINSWRPHSSIPTKDELGEKIIPEDSEFSMKNIVEDCGIDYNKFKAKCKKQV